MSPASPRKRWTLRPYKERRNQALAERSQTIGWLRKKGKTPDAHALAGKLEECRSWQRCGSGACRVCSTIAQEHLGRALAWAVHQRGADLTAFTLTVATEAEATPVGKLRDYDPINHARRLRRLLQGLPITWAVGGLDVSLNEHRDGRYYPHWLPHFYIVGVTSDIDLLRQQLVGSVSATDRFPRPLRLKVLKGGRKPFLYLLKPDFVRRVGREGVRHVRTSGLLRACRVTTKQRLRSGERLELALFLDCLGLPSRIIGLRCQVHQNQRSYMLRLTP